MARIIHDCLYIIFSFLGQKELKKASSVCKSWNRLHLHPKISNYVPCAFRHIRSYSKPYCNWILFDLNVKIFFCIPLHEFFTCKRDILMHAGILYAHDLNSYLTRRKRPEDIDNHSPTEISFVFSYNLKCIINSN